MSLPKYHPNIKRKPAGKKPTSNILTCLPSELLREVLMYLDLYSLRTLIQTYNEEFKDLFLLVTDSVVKGSQPEFFKNLNVKRIKLSQFDPVKYPALRPLIKLFEYVDRWNGQTKQIWRTRQDYYADNVHPFMDQYSFVYISRIPTTVAGRSCFLKASLTNANSIIHCSGYKPNEITFGPPWSDKGKVKHQRKNSTVGSFSGLNDWPMLRHFYSDIKSLEIQYVNQVVDLRLEQLVDLSIFFGVGEAGDSTGPTIRNLVAPSLRRFTVLYHDIFPIIEKVRVGDCRLHLRTVPLIWHDPTMFRLIQVDAARRQSTPLQLPVCDCVLDTDLAFTGNFNSIDITGGSDLLIGLLDLRSCIEFSWKQANFQGDGHVPITELIAPELEFFSFDTLLENAIVPIIHSEFRVKTLSISTSALGLDLNGVLEYFSEELERLSITCTGFPPKDDEFSKPTIVDLRDFDWQFPSIEALVIFGFCEVYCDEDKDTKSLAAQVDLEREYCDIVCCEDYKGLRLICAHNDAEPMRARPAKFRKRNRMLP